VWRRFAPFVLALLTASVLLAGAAEVYGRPLRGLSTVTLAEITAHPERYRSRALRIAGEVREAGASRMVLSEAGVSVSVESDGTFTLPSASQGARVTAEGKLRSNELVFVATGLEVRR
jgi:hypothetical protein